MLSLPNMYPYEIVLYSTMAAQFLKFFLYGAVNRRPSLRVLVTTNGLPSLYAVMMSSLCTVVALDRGVDSPIFAGAFVFAGIVLHDIVRVQGSVDKGQRAALVLANSVGAGSGPAWAARLMPLLGDRGHRPLHVFLGVVLGLLAGLAWNPR